ncbi:hypothetical protein J2Z79_003225 [Symbiobacterium terraclitae]|uniref:Uncharacterized protein n=1 Tax=Symbiobacterium terraclitae TaxID=557451 RepID=A0ABS4JW58_9FIRM|nr:hypothetical protein [Symbiobacterium terraclitae]MBP2019783.1 hypothetical protein [Symbiobacterium terraclitae]
MRRPVLLAAFPLLLVYVALAAVRTQSAPAPGPGIAALDRAVAAAGGHLEEAALFVTEPVADPDVGQRLAARLGWGEGEPPSERRRLAVEGGIGGPVLSVEWRLTGEAAAGWADRYAALKGALAAEGMWVPVQVELSGRAAGADDPLTLAGAALDGLAARARQPWAGDRAASIAGWSPLLPPGPYEVNVQVAVRQQPGGDRFWIGWPLVRSDY